MGIELLRHKPGVCHVCGVETAFADGVLNDGTCYLAVCPQHCPGHEFKHDEWRRSWFCEHCDEERPDDYYD